MSGVFKSIGKVFKKVVKVVKKIALPALAIAAVVFTGGAALGLLPTFGAAMGGLIGGLGLSAGATTALTGALVNAGFGGAVGFIASGGKMKGLETGGLAGLVTGGLGIGTGITGAAKGAANALASRGLEQTIGAATSGAIASAAPSISAATGTGGLLAAAPAAAAPAAASALPTLASAAAPLSLTSAIPSTAINAVTPSVAAAGAGAPAAASGIGGLLGGGNSLTTAMALQGLGGALTAPKPGEEANAQLEAYRKNYSGTGGLLTPKYGTGAQPDRLDPVDAFSPERYNPDVGRVRYVLDKTTNRVVAVPAEAI